MEVSGSNIFRHVPCDRKKYDLTLNGSIMIWYDNFILAGWPIQH
jgi:hypothetical protein